MRRSGIATNGAVVSAAVLFVLAAAAPAVAQEDNNPLRFLRPWLERQLQGGGPESGAAAAKNVEPGPDSTPEPAGAAGPIEDPAATAAEVTAPAPALPARDMPAEAGSTDTAAAPSGDASGAAMASSAASEESGPPPQSAQSSEPPLRIAVLAGRSVAETMKSVGPIADDLRSVLARPVEVLPMTSYAAMIDAHTERRIDAGFYSASAFVAADAQCECLEPLVAPKADDGTTDFQALVVTRQDSGIASLADLRGKTVAMGAPDSMGNRRMQLAGLLAENVDPGELGSAMELESGGDSLRAVMRGEADAAFVWSSTSGDAGQGYSRGTLQSVVAGGDASPEELAVVWRSPPLAHGPLAVARTMAEEDKDAIASYLLDLESRRPAAYDALAPFYGGGYARVDAEDYSGLAALAAMDVDAVRLPEAEAGGSE